MSIIGSACRFPGAANSPEKLWELLKQPRDVLSTFPQDRLNLQSFYHPKGEHHGCTNVQNKAYLLSEDIRLFDASFFRISPAEAATMDPQQRLLLETVYEALEAAGLSLKELQGSLTSVWAGLMNGDFADIQGRDIETLSNQHATGTHRSILSNRISYFLDVRGPSMTIDTACSSSLVALHQAVQSLRSGESDYAIVAGANLILDPAMYVAESKLHMLSPDSRSRMWDKDANGYARGEGFAAIVLQRLRDAARDGNSIECVVRGTAVNSDGRGNGAITVPSAAAQTALIRRAYKDAGLDARRDRCQYFEAHGTGTQAGDPVEAQAIRDSFFSSQDDECGFPIPQGNLLVGSIKTVIGHVEGCAGLAGVLKASLAIQHRMIPPNMLFSELNPAITPFYDHLEIPTDHARAWPATKPGSPLRVSVNSFGFGGTNAHVILESYRGDEELSDLEQSNDEPFIGPLVFSANSKDSLMQTVQAYMEEIRSNKSLNLINLSWTLHSRRNHFSNHRATFSGVTRQKLINQMCDFIASGANTNPHVESTLPVDQRDMLTHHASSNAGSAALLGIFTGQGAQWASMGRKLILHCRLFRESIERCEKSLSALGGDAPEWSLVDELIADSEKSRVAEAPISQPLCTAVQIGLVDLLQASGIRFRAVVGHSSGEIAAAYAAGILPRASDAIRIAYYRGLHTKLVAKARAGKRGSMLAAALSWDEASELCARPEYAGQIGIAAANSSTSVTLSGDANVIEQVNVHLTMQGTFARKLKVDMAYHSNHMEICVPAYLDSLQNCNIQVHKPSNDCTWVSSVHGDVDSDLADDNEGSGLEALKGQYWADNLTNTVLFAPAVESALWRAGPFDAVLEVGPHPALEGPATEIFKASLGASLPYSGVMRRGTDDIEAFSSSLGYLWKHLGPSTSVDFEGYRHAFRAHGSTSPRLLKGLPSYRWDHMKVHWKESRISRNFRLAERPCNELLGRRVPDDTSVAMRWRNVLHLDEIHWVKGHVFQGQVVLPGATYISAVMEAVKVFAGQLRGGLPADLVKVVELHDVVLHRAVVLRENSACEFMTSLSLIHKRPDCLAAEFSFSAAQTDSDVAPEITCTGRVKVHLGGNPSGSKQAEVLLPLSSTTTPILSTIDVDLFYSSLDKVGLAFSGPFRGTKSVQRSLGYASASASWDRPQVDVGTWSSAGMPSLHPAVLDVGLHALFAAFVSPATEQLCIPYLPVAIRRVSIIPSDCPSPASPSSKPNQLNSWISAKVTSSSAQAFEGDVQIAFDSSSRIAVQVEGIEMRGVADQGRSPAGDCKIFSNITWKNDISSGIEEVVFPHKNIRKGGGEDEAYLDAMGRTALFYYRKLLETLCPDEVEKAAWHHRMFVQSAQHWVEEVGTNRHPTVRREWLRDEKQAVWHHSERFRNRIDLILMRAVGENLASIIRGEKQPLEVMMEDDMLTRFYVDGRGLDLMNEHIARAVGQITHRYPRANILEIGAGTGGTTRKVLGSIGNTYGHYTFTDVSPGFFERASAQFCDQAEKRKMSFQVLDIEKDVVHQGFSEGTYDVVVAANVVHATKHLAATMHQVRRLLRPGGYLIMLEITGDLLRLGFILGTLPGWWLGPKICDEGRRWAPGIPTTQWHGLLQRTGFSGVDHAVSDSSRQEDHYLSVMVAQAIDDRVNLLRNPLPNLTMVPALHKVAKLLIIGGDTPAVARLAQDLSCALAPLTGAAIQMLSNIDQVVLEPHESISAVSLSDLEHPSFGHGTASRLGHMQAFLQCAQSVLWVTNGCRGSNPQANIFVGLARAIRAEQRDINLQILDVGAEAHDAQAFTIAEAFVRLALTGHLDSAKGTLEAPSVLWSTEAELALDNGVLMIPRLVPDQARNDRYNASRRIITRKLDEEIDATWDFEVKCSDGVLSLLGFEGSFSRRVAEARVSNSEGKSLMKVQLSVALFLPEHQHFLCYGTIPGPAAPGSEQAFAITRSNASTTLVSDAYTIPAPCHDWQTASSVSHPPHRLLEAFAGQLVARSLVARVPRSGSILLFNPPLSLATAIMSCRLWKGRHVCCAASTLLGGSIPEGWISIPSFALASSIREMLPADLTAIIDLSVPAGNVEQERLLKITHDCVVIRFEPSFLDMKSTALHQAYADALAFYQDNKETIIGTEHDLEERIIHKGTLTGLPTSSIRYPSMIDFSPHVNHDSYKSGNATPEFQVQALSVSGIFSSSKTHLMVGLNGNLGLSICSFMAQNGARHIAIASRAGQVDAEWIELMHRQGINIGVYAMDVTKREDVLATLDQMRIDGMPPVGGVANGALVLRDKLFMNMDAESMNETLRPKVDGSRYLDELCGESLDYFVLFSSLATVAGNAGQSSYHAANMFMTGLAANRRARGLAASVMHVAVVADAGYVTRQGGQLLRHLREQFFMPTSESDAHQLFAEAVLASPPDSELPYEICMGLESFPYNPEDDDSARPTWVSDPRLSHFVYSRLDQDRLGKDFATTLQVNDALPLKNRISDASTGKMAEEILSGAFVAKLEKMLQLDEGSLNVYAPLLDVGFDSLLAVETRAWFLREVSIDIPVLRFLGNDTVHEICANAVSQLLGRGNLNDRTAGSGSDGVGVAESHVAQMPPASTNLSASTALADIPVLSETSQIQRGMNTGMNTEENTNPSAITHANVHRNPKHASEIIRTEKLSFSQSRLWTLGHALDDPAASNIAVSYNVIGHLNVHRLRDALAETVRHHSSLRTCFFVDNKTNEPMQGLLRSPLAVTMSLKEVRAITRTDGVLSREFSELKRQEWDFMSGKTFKTTLVDIEDEDTYTIIFGYPLIIMDGVSWSVFLSDLGRAYSMQPLSHQAKLCIDSAAEQRQAVESRSGAMPEAISYWQRLYKVLPESLPLLPFASTRSRQPMTRFEVHKSIRNIDRHLVSKIKEAAKSLRATPFHFYLTVAQALILKLLPTLNELCIGVFDANRPDDNSLSDVVGYFVNVLPLRLVMVDKEQESFAEMLRRTSSHELEARRYRQVPFDVILDCLEVPHDPSVSPLCQLAFNYRVGAMADVGLGNCRLAMDHYSDVQNNRYDFSFGLFEDSAGSHSVTVTCKSYIYNRDAAEYLVEQYVRLLQDFASDFSSPLQNHALALIAAKSS